MQRQGRTLNDTFVPKTILRKTSFKNINPLLEKSLFQKTHGNAYLQLDPPQIKFNAYELNKTNTLTFKIINKAPIPQRFNILPPTQPYFSIKVNKKGSIPTGMYETVAVLFKASEYKYLYDVVKINTETDNFVVPIYAYPSIPNLSSIFPKLIDFGNIEVSKTETFLYPISNPTPIDFKFEFTYKKQCAEIMINPLSGIITANAQTVIQISYVPNKKNTSIAEVDFKIQQFDFEPIFIHIIGSGKQKETNKNFKRLKSSRLVPLKEKEDDPDKWKDRMDQTQSFFNEKVRDPKKSFVTNVRKTGSKVSFPKLLTSTLKQKTTRQFQSTVQPNSKISVSSVVNEQEKRFLNRFNKIFELDKEKEIKFSQYLGDRKMTEQQLQTERSIVKEMKNFMQNLLKTQCETRFNPQKNQFPQVEFSKIQSNSLTWDQDKNDHIYERKAVLNKLVIAASKIIESRRINKRFQKIKLFLQDCSNKEEVAKKVETSYQKSLDSHSLNAFHNDIDLQFSIDSLRPSYFKLQFDQGTDKFTGRAFLCEGKPQFDDLTTLNLIEQYESEKMGYHQLTLPPQFVYLSRQIPAKRVSGEEEFSVKSASLPSTQPVQLLDIAGKPFEIPNHFFIHQKQTLPLFNEYNAVDERHPSYLFSIDQPIEDEFQGWSKGDFQVLKAKLLKNTFINYQLSSDYNYCSQNNDIGFLGDITKNLPHFIDRPIKEDQIPADDSDDENYDEHKVEKVDEFLQKIQNNPEIKIRRSKNQIEDENKRKNEKIEKNLQRDKLKKVTEYIQKVQNFNKMAEKTENLLIV